MTSIKENPKLRAAAEQLRKSGVQIGDAVSETLKTMEESDLMRAVRTGSLLTLHLLCQNFQHQRGLMDILPVFQISRASTAVSSTIATSTEPIRNTGAYKALSETITDALDDSGSAKHAGYEAKEERRKRRAKRLAKAGVAPSSRMRTAANPECVVIFPISRETKTHLKTHLNYLFSSCHSSFCLSSITNEFASLHA